MRPYKRFDQSREVGCQTDRSDISGNTRGKWNDIFRLNRANQMEWLLPFFTLFPNSLHKWNLLKRIRALNGLVKIERQIKFGPTDQSPLGIPEENGTTFSDQTGPTKRDGSYHFSFLFRISYISEIYWREVGQWTDLSKWNGGGPIYSGRTKLKPTFPFDFWPKFLESLA